MERMEEEREGRKKEIDGRGWREGEREGRESRIVTSIIICNVDSQSRRIDDVKIIFLDVTQLNEEVSVILYIIIVSNGYAELSLCL